MFSWFSRWLKRASKSQQARPVHRRSCRLFLEPLEERALLNNRFVVPVGVAPDNSTTFTTLHDALTTSGLVAGDVIQIEPGSAPGGLKNADLPSLANLTIQGDPAVAASELPAFTIEDAVTIVAAQAGFTLRNVNVTLQGGGLTFQANFTVANSLVTDNYTGGTGIKLDNTNTGVIRDSNIVNVNGNKDAIGALISVVDSGNNHNLISNNTVVSYSPALQYLLEVQLDGTATDQVVNNRFLRSHQPGSFGETLIKTHGLGAGLTIQGNFIQDLDGVNGRRGLLAESSLLLSGNTFKIPNGFAVSLQNGDTWPGATMTLTIVGNQFDTSGLRSGLNILPLPSGTYNLKIEGNDFHNNLVGISIDNGNRNPSLAGIDLGGGSQGSRGANNFRGFTAAATSSAGAIIVSNTSLTQGLIKARNNLFSVVNPETVVWDRADDSNQTDVDVAFPLLGNAAFVETLYLKFLHRTGDTTNPNDAGGWVSALNTGTPASAVASAIARSGEALGYVVDGLYRQYLNRDADPTGRAGFVSYLQGHTLEQAITQFVTSAEYRLRFGSDGAFVQSLYVKLLGRIGSNTEIAGWIAAVPTQGRAAVAGAILGSAEYRGLVVRSYYATLLHRTPADSEVNGWVNTGLDLLTIEVTFAGTGEFQTNG